jgi:hypothetical protein
MATSDIYDKFFDDVTNFTLESGGITDSLQGPRVIPKDILNFTIKSVISELYELLELERDSAKVYNDFNEKKKLEFLGTLYPGYSLPEVNIEEYLINTIKDISREKKTVDKSSPHFKHGYDYDKSSEIMMDHMAGQADALADIIYYVANSGSKMGVKLGRILYVIHKANMNKRNKTTGKFEKNAEGKVMKPKDWEPADIKSVIINQVQESTKEI